MGELTVHVELSGSAVLEVFENAQTLTFWEPFFIFRVILGFQRLITECLSPLLITIKKVNVTLGWRLIPNWKGVLLYSTWLKSVKNFSTPFYILGGFFFLLQLQYDKEANMVFLNTFSVTSFSILVWRKSFRYFFSIR